MNNTYKFEALCSKVEFCSRCPRMDESARILSRAAGPLNAALMFIGEAPGRLGADDSGVPFHGDVAGHNFEELLAFAGIGRDGIYVTNAVLCNPRDFQGNNSTPNPQEIDNCAAYLREQLELVNPAIVVSLGATALNALKAIESHEFALATHVRSAQIWNGRKLIPLYHPGRRAMIHRSMANQRSDYQFVAEELRRIRRPQISRVSGVAKEDVASLVRIILGRVESLSYFALHKLLFLIECDAWKELGHPLTQAFFLRQKDGPYCTDAHLGRLKRSIPDLRVLGTVGRTRLQIPPTDLFAEQHHVQASTEMLRIVTKVMDATSGLTDAQIKTKVYMSSPMRAILRAERTQLVNLYNAPIPFSLLTSAQPAMDLVN